MGQRLGAQGPGHLVQSAWRSSASPPCSSLPCQVLSSLGLTSWFSRWVALTRPQNLGEKHPMERCPWAARSRSPAAGLRTGLEEFTVCTSTRSQPCALCPKVVTQLLSQRTYSLAGKARFSCDGQWRNSTEQFTLGKGWWGDFNCCLRE